MNETAFYGQHDDERVLYTVTPHRMGTYFAIGQLWIVVLLFLVVGWFIFSVLPGAPGGAMAVIFLVGLLFGGIATFVIWRGGDSMVGYITDRRIIRFNNTLFDRTTRSLTWDEAVKVKTYSPSFLLRMLKVGTVVVHARTAGVEAETGALTSDDVELPQVEYYADLGNYIEKILYLYKKKPEQLETMRPFVAKPKGQRY